MYVDFNNYFYAQNLAYALAEHINRLPNDQCCPAETCCYTCNFIQTLMKIDLLDAVLDVIDNINLPYKDMDFYDWSERKVDYGWIRAQWQKSGCPIRREEARVSATISED